MRRWLALAILLAVVIAGETADAKPHRPAVKICTQKATTAEGVKALIKCFAPKIGVSTSHALYVANRESRYQPRPTGDGCNSSDHCGVYQDAQAIWNYEAQHYVYGAEMRALLQPGCDVHHATSYGRCSGRASVILNLRYVRHNGWGPWGG